MLGDHDPTQAGVLMHPAVSAPAIGGLGVLYIILFVALGITSIKKGHWVMFIVGIFIPLFWLIGALMPPVRR
jgi:hypothetical protein